MILQARNAFFDYFDSNILLLIITSAVVAFLISYKSYPIIIHLVKTKKLMDQPVHRSSHCNKVPTLGGVGVFIAVSMTMGVIGSMLDIYSIATKLISLFVALVLLFFMGIKDDLLVLSPQKKIMGQLLAAFIVILLADVRVQSFGGLFGIQTLPLWASLIFTAFVFVCIINAFNLIDGIDGLAGTVAILCSASFGVFFIQYDQHFLGLVSFSLIGALMAFLCFNLGKKVFMGDTGSMVIGFLLSFQAIGFLNLNQLAIEPKIANPPILALSILAFPIMDTLRVFVIRISQNRNPFKADRNHIHHRLLDLGFSHLKATTLVSLSCVLITVFAYSQNYLEIHLHLVVVFTLAFVLTLIPFGVVKITSTPKRSKISL